MSADNIILNSCQYTPVYFIENPGVSQARSYVLAPNNQGVDKPVSETLKRFYENSGKLESNLNVGESSNKPRIIKKHENNVVGNNLKLASFLLPKCETKNELSKPIVAPVNNVVLKPVYIANNISVNNINASSQVPKLDVNSRLVKLKDMPNIVRSQNGRILPKIKPKENSPSNKQKHTAVQLVKLGETYHSLNQLSNDQMKIVNHALKIFSHSQSTPPEPAYDPSTNTKFIYKVVSQKDFALADRNKVNKHVNTELNKETVKIEKTEIIDEEPKVQVEAKVTRSGRVVKLPKNIIVDDSPTKPKRKNTSIVSCLQCSSKFSSPQRLHRHYENHPTHLPNKFHNNLFHCLIAIVSAGPESDRANILIDQLEQFINKLKSCIPCLLKTDECIKEKSSVINEDISMLFGINPGNYKFNIDALNCEKDQDGYCSHKPPPIITCTDNIKPQIILQENNENGIVKGPSNISKSKFSERRPTILRKVECRKQKLDQNSHDVNGKKIKLSQDSDTNNSSLEIDDIVALLSNTVKTEGNIELKPVDKVLLNDQRNEIKADTMPDKALPKPPHIQFHSTHFDIRSSPIKPTSTVFRKFQINPEKMAKYEIEIIRPIQLNQLAQDVEMKIDNNLNAQSIFDSTNVANKELEDLNYTPLKDWHCEEPQSFMKANNLINDQTDNFMKSNSLIEPALLHVKNGGTVPKVTDESALIHAKNGSTVTNAVTNQIDNFMKSNIIIEPRLLLEQDEHKGTNRIPDQTDFMKSDILIEQALLNTQNECKVIDEITNRGDDFMKSNILIEPALLHSQDNTKLEEKYTDQTHNFMKSDAYLDPTLSLTNHDHKVMDITENNEIDIDLTTSQGQSIISFLESLGNELAYTETENRNNCVDFQLDLFSFNHS